MSEIADYSLPARRPAVRAAALRFHLLWV